MLFARRFTCTREPSRAPATIGTTATVNSPSARERSPPRQSLESHRRLLRRRRMRGTACYGSRRAQAVSASTARQAGAFWGYAGWQMKGGTAVLRAATRAQRPPPSRPHAAMYAKSGSHLPARTCALHCRPVHGGQRGGVTAMRQSSWLIPPVAAPTAMAPNGGVNDRPPPQAATEIHLRWYSAKALF